MRRWTVISLAVAGLGLLNGCSKDQEGSSGGNADETKPRQIGTFSERGGSGTTTQPSGMTGSTETRPAASMPNDAIHARLKPGADVEPQFAAPPEWQPKPARAMTEQVFVLPRVEGDVEDADLAVSTLGRHVPLDMNISRWCSQFGLNSEECQKATKQQKLEGTKFPTTIVEISGTYQPSGGPMMQAAGPAKPGYKMLAAELIAPQDRWFVKLIGPEKTVEKWREAFMKYVKEAK